MNLVIPSAVMMRPLGLLFLVILLACRANAQQPLLRMETGGHIGAVTRVLWTQDRLISVGQDKAVRVWDARTGEMERVLRGYIGNGRLGELYALAAFGNLLLTGGTATAHSKQRVGEFTQQEQSFVVRLHDLETGALLRLYPGHRATITALAFSPDGKYFVSGAADGDVLLWSRAEGTRLAQLKGHRDAVMGAAFSPDGERVATASLDGTVRFYHARTGVSEGMLTCPAPVQALAYSSSSALAVGCRNRQILIYEKGGRGEKARIWSQKDNPTCLAFSGDGRLLLSGSGEDPGLDDRTVRLWDTDGTILHQWRQSATVLCVAFSEDGTVAASGDGAGNIRLFDLRSRQLQNTLAGTGFPVEKLTWGRGGSSLSWEGTGGRKFALDLNRMRPPRDETWIEGNSGGGRVRIDNTARPPRVLVENAEQKVIARLEEKNLYPGDRIYSAALIGSRFVAVGTGTSLSLWDISSGKARPYATLVAHTGPVLVLSVSPDGLRLASGSSDQTVRIWNLADTPRRLGDTEDMQRGLEPLLSLFAGNDGQWVVWNDRLGYYAASTSGDNRIGWHVNRGEDQTANFFAAYQFRARYYRPDIISRVLETGSIEEARKQAARAETTVPPLAVAIATAPPPVLSLIGGTTEGTVPLRLTRGEEIATTSEQVSLRLRTDAPLVGAWTGAKLKVRVNRPVTSRGLDFLPNGAGSREFATNVSLLPGLNDVQISLEQESGEESAPVSARIRYTPSDQSASVKGRLFLLGIGISRYGGGISSLEYADTDTEAIAAFYQGQDKRLAASVIVRTLLNEQATAQKIRAALIDLAKEVRPADTVLFFLSSHGFTDPDDPTVGYLAPADTDIARIRQTCVPWSDVFGQLQSLRCRNLLLFLDNCYSGSASIALTRQVAAEKTRGYSPGIEMARDLWRRNMLCFAASAWDQESYESPEWKHGAFTFALLKALKGEDPSVLVDGKTVVLDKAAVFVRSEVEKIVRGLNLTQTPTLDGLPGIDKRIPIAVLP